MPELKKLSLSTVASGAAEELFARELSKVLENVKDPNTPVKAKRQIRITVTFAPHEDRTGSRSEMSVTVGSQSKLAPVMDAASYAFVGREDGQLAAFTNDVRQEEMELQSEEIPSVQNRKPKVGA